MVVSYPLERRTPGRHRYSLSKDPQDADWKASVESTFQSGITQASQGVKDLQKKSAQVGLFGGAVLLRRRGLASAPLLCQCVGPLV